MVLCAALEAEEQGGAVTVASPELRWSGRVEAASGGPLGAVRLELLPVPTPLERAQLRREGRLFPKPIAQARTGADGRFEIRAPRPGMWQLRASSPGQAPRLLPLRPKSESGSLPTLVLGPAKTVTVQVRAPEGTTSSWTLLVEDVPETPSAQNRRRSVSARAWQPEPLLKRVDGPASVQIPVEESWGLQLTALGDDARSFAFLALPAPEPGPHELTLTPVPTVLLAFRDAEELPAAGRTVLLEPGAWVLGRTNAEGQLRVPHPLPPGDGLELSYRLLEDDGASFVLPAASLRQEPPRTAEAEARPVEVRLPDPAFLEGSVIQHEDQRAVAGALVWNLSDPSVRSLSGPKGRFRLPLSRTLGTGTAGEPVGSAGATAHGFQPGQAYRARPGDTTAIVLRPATMLRGQVVDGEGQGLPGVPIEAWIKGRWRMPATEAQTMTGQEGHFSIPGAETGAVYQLRASYPGYAPADATALAAAGATGGEPTILVLLPGRRAFGRVLDLGSAPLEGARVTLEPTLLPGDARTMHRNRRLQGSTGSEPEAFTHADGEFEIPDLGPGSYSLHISAAGYADAMVPGVEVSGEDQETDLGSVLLEPEALIEGRIRDPEGRPVAEATVNAFQSSPTSFSMAGRSVHRDKPISSNEEGKFQVSGLRSGDLVSLQVGHPEFVSQTMAAVPAPTSEPLEIALQRGAELSGRVRSPNGDPVPGARVGLREQKPAAVLGGRVLNQNHSSHSVSTGEDGSFTFEQIPAGKYVVTADHKHFQPVESEALTLEPGTKTPAVDLVLKSGASLAGLVRSSSGVALVGARVLLRKAEAFDMSGFTWGSTDAEGRFWLQGLSPGPAVLTVSMRGFRQLERELEVREDSESPETLDLVLEKGITLGGRVVDTEGLGVEGAEVSAMVTRGRGSRGSSTTSAQGGGFVFENLEPGTTSLEASYQDPAGQRFGKADLQTTDGQDVSGIEIVLATAQVIAGQILGLEETTFDRVSILAHGDSSRGFLSGTVDFEGHFRVGPVQPGTWNLIASTGDGRAQRAEVTVAEGVAVTEQDLEFQDGFTVVGRVLQGGEPATGAQIALTPEPPEVSTQAHHGASTAYDGTFTLRGVPAGPYQLNVLLEDRGVHQETLQVDGDEQLDIELPDIGIEGRVADATTGAPLGGALVSIGARHSGGPGLGYGYGSTSAIETDAAGEFSFDRLTAGTWALTVLVDGYGPDDRDLVLDESTGTQQLEILLDPAESLLLEVTLPDGAPASTLFARMLTGETFPDGTPVSTSAGRVESVGQGRFRLPSLPAGSHRLLLGAYAQAAFVVEVTVPEEPLAVRFPAHGNLRIVLAEDSDLSAAQLRLQAADGHPFLQLFWGDQISHQWPAGLLARRPLLLPAGTWTLQGTTAEGKVLDRTVTIAAGGTTELRLP